MVSSQNLKRLKILISDFSTKKTDFFDTDNSSLSDIIFDVFTAETFIMGIADSIVNGEIRNAKQHLKILEKPLLEKSQWITEINTKIDLTDYTEVLSYTKCIEKIRACCLKILR